MGTMPAQPLRFGSHFLRPETTPFDLTERFNQVASKRALGNNILQAEVKDGRGALYLYDIIDNTWGVGPKDFVEGFKILGEIPTDIYGMSPGGDCWAANACKSIISARNQETVFHIQGICASAATTISLGADSRVMDADAQYLIHNCWGFVIGNAADLRKAADDCEGMDTIIANNYERTGNKSAAEFLDIMAEERFMNAEEVLEHGLIDSIASDETPTQNLVPEQVLAYLSYIKLPEAA